MDRLRLLIIGAGSVGLEKLTFLMKSSPNANVTLVAPEIDRRVYEKAREFPNRIRVVERAYTLRDIERADLVVAATNNADTNRQIHRQAKDFAKIVNVADTPHLCDFYMGSIVTRGPLKIAISTNGYSPTLAKRLRQLFEATLPDDIGELAIRLHQFRRMLHGSFQEKVRRLNAHTQILLSQTEDA